jgi:hypothetical protein
MQICLLQRLVAALATNEGVQPKRTEIWRRLKSLTPREVDVLCYVLGGQSHSSYMDNGRGGDPPDLLYRPRWHYLH